jgi:hypothetical protein
MIRIPELNNVDLKLADKPKLLRVLKGAHQEISFGNISESREISSNDSSAVYSKSNNLHFRALSLYLNVNGPSI